MPVIRPLTSSNLLSCSMLSLLLAFVSAPVVAANDIVCELKIKEVPPTDIRRYMKYENFLL